MSTDFKVIPNFEDYEINLRGIVRDRYTKKEFRPSINHKGYFYIQFPDKRVMVHRLLAFAFIPNPNPKKYTIINHIDGNPSNNSIDNLEWCDYRHNNQQAIYQGLKSDSIDCLVRDFDTGIVYDFPSTAEAKRFMGIPTKVDNRHLYPKIFGRLINDKYEFRLKKDILSYPFFYKDGMPKIRSHYAIVVIKDLDDQETYYTFESISRCFDKIKYYISFETTLKLLIEYYPEYDFKLIKAVDECPTYDRPGKPKVNPITLLGYNSEENKLYTFSSYRNASLITKCDRRLMREKTGKNSPVNKIWYFAILEDKESVKQLKKLIK